MSETGNWCKTSAAPATVSNLKHRFKSTVTVSWEGIGVSIGKSDCDGCEPGDRPESDDGVAEGYPVLPEILISCQTGSAARLIHSIRRWAMRFLVVLLLLCIYSNPAAAEAPLPATTLHTITVVGSAPVADDIEPEAQTSFSKVITREQFESKTGSVADVIKQETGVQLRQRGGLGSASSVYLRGANSQQVNIYLDGLLVNAAAGGGVDLSQFLLGNLSSIEIYPDVTPIQLGFPNIGGAVNIRTLKTDKELTRIYGGAGSFSAYDSGLVLNRTQGAHSGIVAAEYLRSENDFSLENNNQTPFNSSDDRVERRNNSEIDHYNALVKYDYALDDKRGMQLMFSGNHKKQGLPDIRNSVDSKTSLETENFQVQSRIYEGFEANRSWSVRTYFAQTDEVYDDRQSRIGLGSNWSRSQSQTLGINPDYAAIINSHLITASLETKVDSYDQENLQREEFSPAWDRLGINLGLQDEWQNMDGSWLVVPALSAIWIRDEGNLTDFGISRELQKSDVFYVARIGAKKVIAEHWTLKSNLARNIRIPSLYELMGDRGFLVGNPDLTPETAIAGDAGFGYTQARLQIDALLFHRSLDNAIVASYDSRGVGRFENVAQAEITGFEFSLNKNLPYQLSIGLRSTLQEPVDRSDIKDRAGKALPGLYEHASSLSLTHAGQRIQNKLEYSLEEGGFYAPGEVEPIEDKHLINYLLSYQFTHSSVAFEANNLLDTLYQDYHRYPAPGRNYFIKLTHDF